LSAVIGGSGDGKGGSWVSLFREKWGHLLQCDMGFTSAGDSEQDDETRLEVQTVRRS